MSMVGLHSTSLTATNAAALRHQEEGGLRFMRQLGLRTCE